MAGTGQGMLQPTKLILTDDFHENLALPGYQGAFTADVAAAPATAGGVLSLFVVPDGCTVEVVDFGFTASTNTVDTNGATTSSIKLDAGATNVVAATSITGGGGATTTLAAGSTASIKRGSTGYTFTAASTAVNNQFGAGTVISATIADTTGSGATGSGLAWVRLKFVSKDMGAI